MRLLGTHQWQPTLTQLSLLADTFHSGPLCAYAHNGPEWNDCSPLGHHLQLRDVRFEQLDGLA